MSMLRMCLPFINFNSNGFSEAELRERSKNLIKKFKLNCQQSGFSNEKIEACLYPLVSYLDEMIIRSLKKDRLHWISHPLQMEYFDENTAGENFFNRLNTLMNEETKDCELLSCYFYCIEGGFLGVYSEQKEEIESIKVRLKSFLINDSIKLASNKFLEKLNPKIILIITCVIFLILYFIFIICIKVQESFLNIPVNLAVERLSQHVQF